MSYLRPDIRLLQSAQAADLFHALGLTRAAGTHQRHLGTSDATAKHGEGIPSGIAGRFFNQHL